MPNGRDAETGETNKSYAVGLARAFAGAIIFAFPLLMTMEMWWLGFYMDRLRLLLFLVVTLLLLFGLSYFTGFEKTVGPKDVVMDALSAFGVGFIASAAMLWLFGVLAPGMSASEIVGKIAVQTVPASIGASVARKQLGGANAAAERDQEERERRAGYAGQLFLMAAGALFVAFNVAPTEEMILIAYRMAPVHALALGIVSIVALYSFVYSADFAGQEERPLGSGFWGPFLNLTIAGYGIALLISLYVLWTFCRTDGFALGQIVTTTVVLGFPAALGAAIARLVV